MSDNQYTINIGTEVDNSNIEELASKLQELEQSAQGVTDTLSSTDGSGLDDAANSADEAANSLDTADEAANNLSDDLQGVDGSGLDDVSNSADNASEGIDNASNSADGFSAAAQGVASMGIAATMLSWADSSGNVSSQWARMAIVMKDTGLSANEVQKMYGAAVTTVAKDTGRAGGKIREFFIQMGGAGITNSKILSDSFKSVAGAAYLTGADVNNLGETFVRLVHSGKLVPKLLASQFKLGMSDMGAAMRKLGYDVGDNEKEVKAKFESMDKNTRASVMSMALSMKGSDEANLAFKKSWSGVKEQADIALAGLFKFAGDLLIPVLIPALILAANVINGVTGAFKSAPGPVQTIFGVLGALAGGLIILVLGLGALTQAWTLLGISQAISTLRTIAGTAATGVNTAATYVATGAQSLLTAAQNAGIVSRLRSTAITVGATVVETAKTVVTYAATAAQWALNAAMTANPIGIIIIAVIALIAALAYLYYNNETVRNGINWLFNGLKALGGYILGGLILAWNALSGFIAGIGPSLASIIMKVIMFGPLFNMRMIMIFLGVVNKARAYMGQLPGIVWNEMMNIGRKIAGASGYIFSQVQAVFGNIVKWAMQALGIASPGYMARAVVGEMNRVVMGISDAQTYAGSAAQGLGAAILDGFGSPSLSVGTSINPSTASLGFDATEINASLNKNSDDNTFKKIVQNNIINQEGIMGPKQAAEYIVKAVMEQLEEENLITGKTG